MNREQRAQRESASRCDRSGCSATEVRFVRSAGEDRDDFGDRDLPKQVAEEDEEEEYVVTNRFVALVAEEVGTDVEMGESTQLDDSVCKIAETVGECLGGCEAI